MRGTPLSPDAVCISEPPILAVSQKDPDQHIGVSGYTAYLIRILGGTYVERNPVALFGIPPVADSISSLDCRK